MTVKKLQIVKKMEKKLPFKINDILTVKITALGPKNVGLSEYSENILIIVPNVELGEEVKVKIQNIFSGKIKYATTKVIERVKKEKLNEIPKVGEIMKVKIDKEGPQGSGIAILSNNFSILVPEGIVGKEVFIKLIRIKSEYGFGKIIDSGTILEKDLLKSNKLESSFIDQLKLGTSDSQNKNQSKRLDESRNNKKTNKNLNSSNILFSKKPMKQIQNLSLKQGWVYFIKNSSTLQIFHETVVNAGNFLFDNIFFEQNDVYLSCIPVDYYSSNFNIFESNDKFFRNSFIKLSRDNQKIKEILNFNIKLKRKNPKARYFSWNCDLKSFSSNLSNKFKPSSTVLSLKKVNPGVVLFIRPFYKKILPNLHSFKKKILKVNNKKEIFSKQFLLNFSLSLLNKQESHSKLISNFPNADLKIFSDFFFPKFKKNKKLNRNLNNSFEIEKINKFQEKYVQKKSKESNKKRQKRFNNFQPIFYFPFPFNFFPLKIEFSIPTLYSYYFKGSQTNFNSFKNISLDFLVSNQNFLNSINNQTEIFTFLILKNQLLFNKINSLNKNQISSFLIKLKENNLLLSLMRQVYSSSCFDFALFAKMAYLGNQKLFARDFMNMNWNKKELTKNIYKNSFLKNKEVDSFSSIPFFKNQFILSLSHKNVLSSTKPFATTSFLSPLEGEIIENLQNTWSLNIHQNSYLLITKKDLFALSLNYSSQNNKKLFSSVSEKVFYFQERKNNNFNKNYKTKEKSQFAKNEKYSNYGNVINSIFAFNQNFLKVEKTLKSDEVITDKESITTIIHYNKKFFKIKGLKIANVQSYHLFRLGSFLIYGDKITSETATDQEGQIIHMNSSKITLRQAQPILASPKGILHSYNGPFHF